MAPGTLLEAHIDPKIAVRSLGYPLIIKAAAGGGGRGMRMIRDAGVDSMPGGGAEIFDPVIREQIAAELVAKIKVAAGTGAPQVPPRIRPVTHWKG